MQLATFDPAVFLRDHWQKKPLLIRNPWTSWTNPFDPGDLAGLAGEDGVEARIIRRTRKTWKVEHGPFPARRFAKPGKHPWTLLVQAVDQVVPGVAALLDAFRFIPNWRVDDVMVSYATDGGGVGPHFDQYDVFLVQGLGRRRWQVGGRCDAATGLLPHDDLRLLADFAATDEWVLEPGDILYVPPGFAHDGVAVGPDCMTYSIGFRAPSRGDLIGHWADDLLAAAVDDDRYADPDLVRQDNPGEIAAAAIDRLHAMITSQLGDRAAFARWFGQYASRRKYPEIEWRPDAPVGPDALRDHLATDARLVRDPASRFVFVRHGPSVVTLFVDGDPFDCVDVVATFAERLCADVRIEVAAAVAASDAGVALLLALLNRGAVRWAD